MEKWLVLAFLVFVVVFFFGCQQLTEEDQMKVDQLSADNVALEMQLEEIFVRVSDGTLTLTEGMAAIERVKLSISKNLKAIDDIKQSSNLNIWGTVMLLFSLFGRSFIEAIRTRKGSASNFASVLLGKRRVC